MSESHKVPYNREYSVTVEDAMVRVMVYDLGFKMPTPLPHPLSILHSHSFTELFVCTSGSITICTENGDITLSANDSAIIPSYMTHTKLESSIPAVWHSVAFSLHKRNTAEKSDFYETLYALCSSQNAVVLRNNPGLCESVSNLTKSPNVFYSLPALRMCLCLAEIADTYKSDSVRTELREPTPVDINHAMKLEGIIEAYYADNLSSEQIAKLMSVSKRQLSRIVQKRYGTTLRHVIMKKRLSVAAVMLENTHVSIQEIANNVGFNDVSVFRREFRSYYCATPTEYRELMKNSKIKRD